MHLRAWVLMLVRAVRWQKLGWAAKIVLAADV